MLTFEFTGVAGSMTEKERLTSGMVGKQIRIRLSDDWAGLNCTVVFVAGDICRTAAYSATGIIIPEDILRYPFRKLLVGVWGTSSDDTQVIPTILAEGPFVELGANPYADPVAVEVPVWQNLQEQIGNLTSLSTAARNSLVAALNELARDIRNLTVTGGEASIGGYFLPRVSENGVLSWSNNLGLENPESVTVRGDDGLCIFPVDATVSYGGDVLVSTLNVKPDYVDNQGRPIQVGDHLITTNGILCRVAAVSGTGVSATAVMSLKGDAPIRGTDYWTEEDIAEIKAYVDEAILGGAW